VHGEGRTHGTRDMVLEALPRLTGQEPHVDGEEPPLAPHDRRGHRVPQERRDGLGLQGRGTDEEHEVRPHLALRPARHREGEVRVEAPLVELVEDDGAHPLEEGVVEQPPQQDALRGVQDPRRGPRAPVEAHVPADLTADLDPELLGDAARRGAGGDPPRLDDHDGPEPRRREGRGTRVVLPGARGRNQGRAASSRQRRDDVAHDGVDREGVEGHGLAVGWRWTRRDPGRARSAQLREEGAELLHTSTVRRVRAEPDPRGSAHVHAARLRVDQELHVAAKPQVRRHKHGVRVPRRPVRLVRLPERDVAPLRGLDRREETLEREVHVGDLRREREWRHLPRRVLRSARHTVR
jgi:hypothetical protein